MASVFIITDGPNVMGGCVSRADADHYASLHPSLKVSEVVVDGVLYWFTLPAAKRLAPRGTISADDAREIRQEIARSDVSVIFADIVGQIGRRRRQTDVRRRIAKPKLRALPGGGGGGMPESPVRVRTPDSVPSLREYAARSPRRIGHLPPGPA